MQVKRFRELGERSAERQAARYDNVVNANEAAVASLTSRASLQAHAREFGKIVAELQRLARIDLSDLLLLQDEPDRHEALASFCGGCHRYLEENPD